MLLFTVNTLVAQQDKSIGTPGSPAFSILQYEPASVMKPGSAKSLGADILNSFDKNGKLQLNLGLEFAPYWLKSRPYLTRKEYLESDPGQTFKQSFLISAATVKDSISGNNKLGIGFRFKLFNGRPTDEYKTQEKIFQKKITITGVIAALKSMVITEQLVTKKEVIDQLVSYLKDPLMATNTDEATIRSIKELANIKQAGFTDTRDDLVKFVEALNDEYDATNKKLKTQIAELSKKRIGFILEMAGAASFFTDKKQNVLERAGFWATASNFISLTDAYNFTARYFLSNKDSAISNIDAGLSYVKEFSQYSISLEAMARWYHAEIPAINGARQPIKRVEHSFAYRLGVQATYKISDLISINLSLGKNFEDPFISGNSYFSIIGLNCTIFNLQKTDLAK